MSNSPDTAGQKLQEKIQPSARALLNIYAPHAELPHDWDEEALDAKGMLHIHYDVPCDSPGQASSLCLQLEKIAPKLAEKGIVLEAEELPPPDERGALKQPFGDCQVSFTMPNSHESIIALSGLTRSLAREHAQQIITAATHRAKRMLEVSLPNTTIGDLNREIANLHANAQFEIIGHIAKKQNER